VADTGLISAPARDLDAEIADLERPRGHEIPVRGMSPADRLYSIAALHRMVPDRLAMQIASAIGGLRWYWPPTRRRAIARVALTVAATPREAEAGALAREELSIQAMRRELDWRPWLIVRAPVEGLERLEELRAAGQPTIFTTAHIGAGSADVMAARGYRYAASAGPWIDPDTTTLTGYAAFRARKSRSLGEGLGIRYVTAGGSYELLRELLERGETCWVVCDVPGQIRTRMAGKTAYLTSGPARLAHETGAAVVPLVALLHADGPHVRVLEPIDARTVSDPQEIVDRLAAIYGELMVRHPEQVEPTSFTRHSFRDDSEDYPLALWFPARPHARAKAKARRALARALPQKSPA
jgi:lauroyl/myristoyl acyltransferase